MGGARLLARLARGLKEGKKMAQELRGLLIL